MEVTVTWLFTVLGSYCLLRILGTQSGVPVKTAERSLIPFSKSQACARTLSSLGETGVGGQGWTSVKRAGGGRVAGGGSTDTPRCGERRAEGPRDQAPAWRAAQDGAEAHGPDRSRSLPLRSARAFGSSCPLPHADLSGRCDTRINMLAQWCVCAGRVQGVCSAACAHTSVRNRDSACGSAA